MIEKSLDEINILKKLVTEILAEIEARGKDSPIRSESKAKITLFELLCDTLSTLKFAKTQRKQTSFTVVLSAARMSKGLTQKRMAECLNMPLRTLEDWESGARMPTNIVKINEWLKICGVSIDFLLDYHRKIKGE